MCWHSAYATGWKILVSISDRREILPLLKTYKRLGAFQFLIQCLQRDIFLGAKAAVK